MAELAEVEALRRRRLWPLDEEIHDHFGFLLARPMFATDVQADIQELYLELMMTDTITARALPDSGDASAEVGDACSCPICGAQEDVAGEPWPTDAGADSGVAVPPRRHEHESTSLRDLYRELASRYHPDKAGDEESRIENERLMRQINEAYAAGDLDSLAALSQELGFDIAGDGVLEALATQYERLKAEVRTMRCDVLGQLVVETRRCQRRGMRPPLRAIAEDIHGHADHLEGLAGLFRALRADELAAEDFLVALLGDDDGGDELDDSAILAAMLAALAGPPRPSSSRDRPARKRGKNRKKRRRERTKSRSRRKR